MHFLLSYKICSNKTKISLSNFSFFRFVIHLFPPLNLLGGGHFFRIQETSCFVLSVFWNLRPFKMMIDITRQSFISVIFSAFGLGTLFWLLWWQKCSLWEKVHIDLSIYQTNELLNKSKSDGNLRPRAPPQPTKYFWGGEGEGCNLLCLPSRL